MEFYWKNLSQVLHLEISLVRREGVGGRGKEAATGFWLFWRQPPGRSWFNYKQVVVFLCDLLPRWFSLHFISATKFWHTGVRKEELSNLCHPKKGGNLGAWRASAEGKRRNR